jgi:hypothetical protein
MKSTRTRLRSRRRAFAALCVALAGASGAPASEAACDGDRAAPAPRFALEFGGEVSPLPLVATSVMPGAELAIEAVARRPPARFEAEADGGALERVAAERWRWRAPNAPGASTVRVAERVSGTSACLRVFVLRPYGGEEALGGFQIGAYPPGTPPAGLIRADADMVDLPVSPHFRLGQFLPRQEGFPKYLVLRTRLLLALEAIASELREKGVGKLEVMSGYRTPHYHAKIGNVTTTSRHLFGDAADVFLDGDGDGRMDDLDGDRAVTDADARLLYAWIDAMSAQPWYEPFTGGLSLYPTAPHRGPFVHVDVRGLSVRW